MCSRLGWAVAQGLLAFLSCTVSACALTWLGCCAGGLKPFSAMPAPPQTFLLGNLPDLTKGDRMQFHLVLQRWAEQLGPVFRCVRACNQGN